MTFNQTDPPPLPLMKRALWGALLSSFFNHYFDSESKTSSYGFYGSNEDLLDCHSSFSYVTHWSSFTFPSLRLCSTSTSKTGVLKHCSMSMACGIFGCRSFPESTNTRGLKGSPKHLAIGCIQKWLSPILQRHDLPHSFCSFKNPLQQELCDVWAASCEQNQSRAQCFSHG